MSSSPLLVLLQRAGVIVLQQPHILQDSLCRLLGNISSGILVGGKLSCVINFTDFHLPLWLHTAYSRIMTVHAWQWLYDPKCSSCSVKCCEVDMGYSQVCRIIMMSYIPEMLNHV